MSLVFHKLVFELVVICATPMLKVAGEERGHALRVPSVRRVQKDTGSSDKSASIAGRCHIIFLGSANRSRTNTQTSNVCEGCKHCPQSNVWLALEQIRRQSAHCKACDRVLRGVCGELKEQQVFSKICVDHIFSGSPNAIYWECKYQGAPVVHGACRLRGKSLKICMTCDAAKIVPMFRLQRKGVRSEVCKECERLWCAAGSVIKENILSTPHRLQGLRRPRT